MSRHPARHWMNGEFHIHAVLYELIVDLAHAMLRLGDRQPIPRYDHDSAGVLEQVCRVARATTLHGSQLRRS